MADNTVERQKTIQEMKEEMVRLEALEGHAKISCNDRTKTLISHAICFLESAVSSEED